ncbi:uncharacterized protein LOC136080727 [Hydra vulgaris]|uniref:Arminin 6560 n=1 Tax=Hydra vulgaris TaxID=6087 RepID=ARM60_HYDVU|nr:arminin 6560 [Hydra vulgaris]
MKCLFGFLFIMLVAFLQDVHGVDSCIGKPCKVKGEDMKDIKEKKIEDIKEEIKNVKKEIFEDVDDELLDDNIRDDKIRDAKPSLRRVHWTRIRPGIPAVIKIGSSIGKK